MTGKKHLLTALVACCLLLQVAGQPLFNKRFDITGQFLTDFGWSVEPTDDGAYLVVGNSGWLFDDPPGLYSPSVIFTLKISPEGGSLQQFALLDTVNIHYPGWSNSLVRLSNGGYALGGGRDEPDGTQSPLLYLFDPDGVLDTSFVFGVPGEAWIGRQAKQTPDGGFVLCGETTNTGYLDGFLLKTDPQGALEWVRTYGGPTYRDLIITVDLAPNGGYYLGGKREPAAFGSFDPWVLRVDSLGEVIWDNTYGSPFDDGPNAHLTTMADGLPVFAGGLATGPLDRSIPRLVKLDENGEVLWERFYGDEAIFNTTFFAVKEIEPGGDLIAVGQHYISNLQVEGIRSGMLLRTTSEGDSLWMRFYQYQDNDVPQGRGTLRDVLPTPDGGFIAVGTASSTPIHDQDLWVVKVDGYGCLEPGCDLITGMETQITNLREALKIYPNPVAQGGTVQVEVQLPKNFKAEGQLRLSVVSSNGRLVREQTVQGTTCQLTPGQLAAGIYHLHLSDNTRWISGAKLIVE